MDSELSFNPVVNWWDEFYMVPSATTINANAISNGRTRACDFLSVMEAGTRRASIQPPSLATKVLYPSELR